MAIRHGLLIGTLVLNATFAATATAQTDPSDASADAQKNIGIDDIVVTAQRRSESGQKVPVTIQSFDEGKLQANAATTTSDLPYLVPGVTVGQTGSSQSIYIRGIGKGGSVLRYIDGVLNVFGTGQAPLGNLASLEVDKGPQSTLFGRNATGGVVQFNTKKPSQDFSADLSLGYANYDMFTGSLYATTGLTETLATDIAVNYDDQKDGWGKNIATGEDFYRQKLFSIRSKTLWEISDRFSATLSLDYSYNRGNQGGTVAPSIPFPFVYDLASGQTYEVGKYGVNVDSKSEFHSRTGIAALRVEGDLDWAHLLSITSYQRNHSVFDIDYDGGPSPILPVRRNDQNTAWTQELQLQSPDGSKASWVVGLFYLGLTNKLSPFSFGAPGASVLFGVPLGSAFNLVPTLGSRSYAAFGQITYPIFPDTRITLGARYTIDRVTLKGYNAIDDVIIPGSRGNTAETFRKPTFRADIQQQFTPSVMGYISYNRGYNSGGFNNILPAGFANDPSPILPETIDAYEAGLKTQFFNNRLRLNISGFYYDYRNLQLSVHESGGLATRNAAAARVKGIDVDFEGRPTARLTISGGFEWLDSEFTRYPDAPIYSVAPNGAIILDTGDAGGNRTPNAPRISYNANVRHSLPTSIGEFSTSVGMNYQSGWFADASNKFFEPKRYLVNISETWKSLDNLTSISLWVKNLGNKYYDMGFTILNPNCVCGVPGAPRTYGITVGKHF
ncbi:TonB-dependent receptor [Sphingobium chlorophenolicum L-1]|uniref:TonB-dependent receptor n=1 Tax=Sphingobium chlorophenolicum L-1 TaxID=690566 RepID=F6F1V5_SPHCR|nr:TonB-dependent receptor [Sphingobium chlorophenolicum]AEG51521.1 TonB-dependent receptor [Sphingobium chlorophenolicum L-1]